MQTHFGWLLGAVMLTSPWAMGQGVTSKPTSPNPNETKIAAEFVGRWSGWWLFPRGGQGLQSWPAHLMLEFIPREGFKGQLEFTEPGAKPQVFLLNRLLHVETRMTGIFPLGVIGKESVSFRGELTRTDSAVVLEIKSDRGGGFLVVRKD